MNPMRGLARARARALGWPGTLAALLACDIVISVMGVRSSHCDTLIYMHGNELRVLVRVPVRPSAIEVFYYLLISGWIFVEIRADIAKVKALHYGVLCRILRARHSRWYTGILWDGRVGRYRRICIRSFIFMANDIIKFNVLCKCARTCFFWVVVVVVVAHTNIVLCFVISAKSI